MYGELAFSINEILKKVSSEKQLEIGEYIFLELLSETLTMIDGQPCYECENCIEFAMNIKLLIKFTNKKIDIEQLKQSLQYWEVARAHDKILNIKCQTTKDDFNGVNKIDKNEEDKITVYLDYNLINDYDNDADFNKKITRIIENGKVWFVYSPIHIEELCRKNNETEERKCISNIIDITNNREVMCYDGKLEICIEHVYNCEKRTRKNMNLVYAGENLRLVRSNDKKTFYPEYLEEQHIKTINNCNLEELSDELLNRILGTVTSPYCIEDYRNAGEKLNDFEFVGWAVRSLYRMLDILAFYSDKKEKTIRSGTYDIEHLIYSTKCDYFVTKDKRLFKRAKEIFRILSINTKVIENEKLTELI
jgi:hypothetical protein